MTEQQLNQQVADQIIRRGGLNGKAYRSGEWLALLDGKVVASAPDLEGAVRELRRLDPDPRRGMIVEAGDSVVDVIR
jgi:hypothetical protein